MTVVGQRLSVGLVTIDGRKCSKSIARKATICKHSKRTIEPGDLVYRPIDNAVGRDARWLASEIDKLEREQRK